MIDKKKTVLFMTQSIPRAYFVRQLSFFFYFGKAVNAPWWSLEKGANAPPPDNTKVAFSND